MSKLKICILGGTGFVGRRIAARLVDCGHRVRIITHRRERHRELLVLPALNLVEGDVHDMGLLRTEFQDMDAVINLVGILNERRHDGKGFHKAHVELAAKVVESCKQAKVRRLLHMSALNANPRGPSHYLRTKGVAENLVHEAVSPDYHVTSFRPSVIFGPNDGLFNRFADLLRRIPFFFPLACGDARFQPVFVDDVARAFVASLEDRRTHNKRYNLCGPKVYTLHELVAYTAKLIGTKRYILDLNDWQSKLQAAIMGLVPGKPFSLDNYNSMKIDSVCEGIFPKIFGIAPTRLEDVVPGYLAGRPDHYADYRRRARRT